MRIQPWSALAALSLLCACGRAPDRDGDGLTDAAEEELGTDPRSADSDGDGFEDLEELSAGGDPLLCWSVPQGWPDCRVQGEDIEGEGFAQGDVVPDAPLVEADGSTLSLRHFSTMVVVIDLSAGWCGPCQQTTPRMQALADSYDESDGVAVVQVMVAGWNQGSLSDGFLEQWRDMFSLSIPVTAPVPGESDLEQALLDAGTYTGSVPSFLVLSRDQELIYVGSESGVAAAVEAAL